MQIFIGDAGSVLQGHESDHSAWMQSRHLALGTHLTQTYVGDCSEYMNSQTVVHCMHVIQFSDQISTISIFAVLHDSHIL